MIFYLISSIALTAGIISILVGCLMSFASYNIFKLYRKKKKIEGLFLALSVISYTLVTFSAAAVYLLSGASLIVGDIFQKLIYTFVFLGTIFTFLFASRIFFKPKNWQFWLYLTIGFFALSIIIFSNSSNILTFPDSSEYPLFILKTEYAIILVGFLFPTSIGVFISARKLSKRVEGDIYKKAFNYISYGIILIPITFIIDAIASIFINNEILYAFFLYLTWAPPPIASYFYFRGYLLPEKVG